MNDASNSYSQVTAILPASSVDRVTQAVADRSGVVPLVWQARGTLLREHWWQRFLPLISPAKSMMHMLVPSTEVSELVGTIVETANLHQQATGAVYSTPCDATLFGSDYAVNRAKDSEVAKTPSHSLTENLNVIYCTVGHHLSARVSKAAVAAGAHGPIVYYAEGRGLRDRLGWLRITKEHEKEVLMILVEEDDADRVFNAIAKAAELHLPGRGFMYRQVIESGMFHLASRAASQHHRANMQQIINAIDHLSGHTHWRDHSVVDVGTEGRAFGIDTPTTASSLLHDQVRLSAIARRDQFDTVIDLILDAGAPGLTMTFGKRLHNESEVDVEGAKFNAEYGLLHCVTSPEIADAVCRRMSDAAESNGVTDIALFTHAVPSVACYIPGGVDYRQQPRAAAAG